MNISEIYSAMGLKIRLDYEDTSADFRRGVLIRIEPSQDNRVFMVTQYGDGAANNKTILCKTSQSTADYLNDLFDSEHENVHRCMFLIDGVEMDCIEVQSYTFQSLTEIKTPINIIVSDELIETRGAEKLKEEFVWDKLGMPALFSLNYKSKKKQNASIRFLGGKRCLYAQNSARGIYAESIGYLKARFDMPVDIYVAPEINFVTVSELPEVNEELSESLEKISNPASYIERWEAYEKLSKSLLEEESEEFGELPYTSYDYSIEQNRVTYEFVLNEELDSSFVGKELGVSGGSASIEQSEKEAKWGKQICVGQIKKISGKVITTLLEADENTTELAPKTGVLTLYTAGDRYIMARRLAARKRMVEHRAPIKSIVALIETGASKFELPSAWRNHKGVTEELCRNFSKAGKLNREQIDALELAINTPDIALIQGPPGTGKTTVIKAICERFREIFEAEEKQLQKADPEHILRSPKILISSFQNEAVDNAISAPLPGDIPAYRKTAQRTKDRSREQYQKALDKWYAGVKSSINAIINDSSATEYVATKRSLDDEFLSYKNAGEPIDKAAALIERYLSYVDIPYPADMVSAARAIISAAKTPALDDELEDPIVRRIEAQRLSPEAFEDDGARNARRLAAYIRLNDELGIPDEIKKSIEAVCDEEYSPVEFNAYIKAVETLRKQFCKGTDTINSKDKDTINKCILNLSNFFSKHYLSTLDSMESKKSLILSVFLNRLEQDYEGVVKKYSMTTAATCQTSLDLRDGIDKIYDLVIVDEAARANPLDLFIPVSMGRKIVLVGDHKQLPHMLEPDVLKVLMDDPKFKDIPEIEKSLFERLFDMFSKGKKPKALPLRKQFRMHPDICKFVSEAFYDNILQTDESITPELCASPKEINDGKPLTFVNIPISKGSESNGVSKSRQAEADVIVKDVRNILKVAPDASIGIITFYSAQAQLIREGLDCLNDEEKSNIEVGTVDAFQGKEFDYVLLSCVRSNSPKKEGEPPVVGFLEKPNRLCVAFSRAIRQLAVYGDAETLMQIPCFSRLFDICTTEGGGCYREC